MNNRLYVGNLSYDMTSDSLRDTFAECGSVTDAHVVTDRETGRARGFGFVTMTTDVEANNAIQQLNGAVVQGRALRVNVAEERRPNGGGGGGDGSRNARGGHRGW